MKYLKNFDYLSRKVSLTINNQGETSFKTVIGGIISLTSIIISISFSVVDIL